VQYGLAAAAISAWPGSESLRPQLSPTTRDRCREACARELTAVGVWLYCAATLRLWNATIRLAGRRGLSDDRGVGGKCRQGAVASIDDLGIISARKPPLSWCG
jgi:hypothetical protein